MADIGDGWTLDDFCYGVRPASDFLTLEPEQWGRVINLYYNYWYENDGARMGNVTAWMFRKLKLPTDTVDVSWTHISDRIKMEDFRFQKIKAGCTDAGIFDDVQSQLIKIEKLRTLAKDTLLKNQKLVSFSRSGGHAEEDEDSEDVKTLLDNSGVKLNAFQTLYIRVLEVLGSYDLRRADGKFFKRIVTRAGIDTPSFVESQTIKEFIFQHTRIQDSFVAWEEVTHTASVFPQLLDYLTTRPLVEAADLEENPHLRSYEGDEFGRFACIYDCMQDMAWPLMEREYWPQMAQDMNEARLRIYGDGNFVPCTPPSPADVCIKHMVCEFPYDLFTETMDVPTQLFTCWRESHDFECRHTKADGKTSYEVDNATLRALLDARFPTGDAVDPEIWGRTWQLAAVAHADDTVLQEFHFQCPEWERSELVRCVLRGKKIDNVACLQGCHRYSKMTLTDTADGIDKVFVPLVMPKQRHRVHISEEEWRTAVGGTFDEEPFTFKHWVRSADGARYYRPHVGRTWEDCVVPEVDHIYVCQRFGKHDRFGIYACKGRTLFKVGELDKNQFTFMEEGIGGCGKSTVMKLMQLFWPFHRMGIMSSNIESKFGMSQVLLNGKALAIYCNEVSKDLNVNQEEWQTSCSGEIGSYAVKHEAPLVCICLAQHFWVGNGFPTHFKNGQLQTSRRIAGVMMEYEIRGRDGGIFEKMEKACGSFQRCMVLAYKEFLMQYGTIDPMSIPETLPPAFASYYDDGRKRTQPIEDFIANAGLVEVKEGSSMLLKTFKDLLSKYRMNTDQPKIIGFGREHYLGPFRSRALSVIREPNIVIDDIPMSNVDVIYGLCEVHDGI